MPDSDMQRKLWDLQSSLDKALRELPQLELSADAKAGSVYASIWTLINEIGQAMGQQCAHEMTMMAQRESALKGGEESAASG